MLDINRGPHKMYHMGRAHAYVVYSPNSVLSKAPMELLGVRG